MSIITRRNALKSGLAAAIGLPLAATEKTIVETKLTAPRRNPDVEAYEEKPRPPAGKSACSPRNSWEEERLLVLISYLRDEFSRTLEAHGDNCKCVACEVSQGISWILYMVYSSMICEQNHWWCFMGRAGWAADPEEATKRLELPEAIVQAFVDKEVGVISARLEELGF